MIVIMLQNWNNWNFIRYIKYVGFEPIPYPINLNVAPSSKSFNVFDFMFI